MSSIDVLLACRASPAHREIYPFLGCYLLAEAVDRGQVALAVHGHAHGGSRSGTTPGGKPVRDVALPVIERSYQVFCLDETTSGQHGRCSFSATLDAEP